MSQASVGLKSTRRARQPNAAVAIHTVRMLPSAIFNTSPPWVPSNVPVIDSIPVPRLIDSHPRGPGTLQELAGIGLIRNSKRLLDHACRMDR